MIEVKILLDSTNPYGNRLTTFLLTYPRFIHCELLTHRIFSRNSASSRAIPVQKMIDRVNLLPAEPIYWGKNQKGMQANEELDEKTIYEAWQWWMDAKDSAIYHAERLIELGVHKQIANRLLEPFAHMETLVSSTEFGNFFNLRAHPDAQPEFQELAHIMLEHYENSLPVLLQPGEWHIPFTDALLDDNIPLENKLKVATARAARISYLNHEGKIELEKDYKLHDDLRDSGHWSPFEHCAVAMDNSESYGNFTGFKQYRKFFTNENQTEVSPSKIRERRKKYV